MPEQSLLDDIRQGYANDEHCKSMLNVEDYRTAQSMVVSHLL